MEYYTTHGRGRNISCNNRDCKNYRHKIGRVRGKYSMSRYCPICGQDGLLRSYSCTISDDGKMNDCNCDDHKFEVPEKLKELRLRYTQRLWDKNGEAWRWYF